MNDEDNDSGINGYVVLALIVLSIVMLILYLTGVVKYDKCDAPQYDRTGEVINDECFNSEDN